MEFSLSVQMLLGIMVQYICFILTLYYSVVSLYPYFYWLIEIGNNCSNG